MSENKAKIVFVTSASNTAFSGGDKHLVQLIQHLDPSKLEPVILCSGADNYSRILKDRCGLEIKVKTGFPRRSFFRAWCGLRSERSDLIVFTTGDLGAFPWYIFLAAKLSGADRVFAIYHNFSDIPPLAPRNGHQALWLARRILGFRVRRLLAAKIVAQLTHRSICVSGNLREYLIELFAFPEDTTVTVRNGVDSAFYGASDPRAASVRMELGISPHDIVLVSACRLVPVKGLEILLRALGSLRDEIPYLKWVIVGEGPSLADLQKASAEMRLSSRIFFAGFKDDIRPYLQAADIFVNPSSATYVECMPLAVLEAMASGLPCIGARAGGVPEIITDPVDGLLVAPGSVDELRTAIKRLASDKIERERMGECARRKVCQQFDIDQCIDQMKAILLQ